MRSGELDTRAQLLVLQPELSVTVIRSVWLDLRARDADAEAQAGLRANGALFAYARFAADLQGGRYLRVGSRLIYIDAALDVDGRCTGVRLSLTELIGRPGSYQPAQGVARAVRVYLAPEAPIPAQFQRPGYRLRAEVAVLEAGRPQAGELMQVDGLSYTILGPVDGGDDGIVRAMWVKRT